jgi:predicted DNA-binding protein with PD1-like motif
MRTLALRLTDGQDLLIEVKRIVDQHDIDAGVILSGVGSLNATRIRLPVVGGAERYITPANVEIDALHGTVSKNGCHLHVTVSDAQGRAFGGHLKEGCIIRTTCEVVVGILDDWIFKRSLDPKTGFAELEAEAKL